MFGGLVPYPLDMRFGIADASVAHVHCIDVRNYYIGNTDGAANLWPIIYLKYNEYGRPMLLLFINSSFKLFNTTLVCVGQVIHANCKLYAVVHVRATYLLCIADSKIVLQSLR